MPAGDAIFTGAQGEQAFVNHFVEHRVFISRAVHDLWGCDYCVEWEGALHKVNVKTMSNIGEDRFFTCLAKKTAARRTRAYTDDEITYFGVVNLVHDRIWMIPIASMEGRVGVKWFGPLYERRRKQRCDAFNWDPYRIK